MNILHIDSAATGTASVSRQLTAAVVAQLRRQQPQAQLAYRDLVAAPPAHMDTDLVQAMRPQPGHVPPASLQAELDATEQTLQEFLDADVVVVGAPMYNFSIPSQLKAWIDRLAQAGRTFRYTSEGPQGLAGGKKVIVVSSRGGFYAGTPLEALDHQEAFLKTVFGFFGITDVQIVRAEGVALGPQARGEAIDKALASVEALSGEAIAA